MSKEVYEDSLSSNPYSVDQLNTNRNEEDGAEENTGYGNYNDMILIIMLPNQMCLMTTI